MWLVVCVCVRACVCVWLCVRLKRSPQHGRIDLHIYILSASVAFLARAIGRRISLGRSGTHPAPIMPSSDESSEVTEPEHTVDGGFVAATAADEAGGAENNAGDDAEPDPPTRQGSQERPAAVWSECTSVYERYPGLRDRKLQEQLRSTYVEAENVRLAWLRGNKRLLVPSPLNRQINVVKYTKLKHEVRRRGPGKCYHTLRPGATPQ